LKSLLHISSPAGFSLKRLAEPVPLGIPQSGILHAVNGRDEIPRRASLTKVRYDFAPVLASNGFAVNPSAAGLLGAAPFYMFSQ
jgi:hypothetical protein